MAVDFVIAQPAEGGAGAGAAAPAPGRGPGGRGPGGPGFGRGGRGGPGGGGGRYRRPYVVVWVEDAEGREVRTVLLWLSQGGPGPINWMPDLSRWYRGDSREIAAKKNLAFTFARPTRPPGSYSVAWDGKDAKGNLVPRGEYTLSVETAREHGPHSLVRRKITIADAPFVEELEGNADLDSVRIEFRPRAAGGADAGGAGEK